MLNTMEQTEGVEKLETGVLVHILDKNESGQRPTRSSTVKVHYQGTLPDGTVFDSTLTEDPVTFPLAQVIPGWRDGLLKMREGETAVLGIPPEQAYGLEGTPDGRIPGGSTIFFKVQLLNVLSAGIGGSPTLLGADGKKLDPKGGTKSGLLGADGKPVQG
jgi:FKBP-type peptidyl-prolyl cis-trans isomerase